MLQTLVIADDFTGALDTGIQFVKYGASVQVEIDQGQEYFSPRPDTEVLVIDSETRPMNAVDAYRTIQRIVFWGKTQGIPVILKKTDSALRGNIGSELQAVCDQYSGKRLFLIPAFPAVNRVTREGRHYIGEELIENSVFGKDPFEPVKHSYIPHILREQSNVSVRCIRIDESIGENCQDSIVVCDTVQAEDIRKRLKELQEKKELALLAGCAGLAEELARIQKYQMQNQKSTYVGKGLFVVCGSLNQITQHQLDIAEESGDFTRIHLSPLQRLEPDYYQETEGEGFLSDLSDLCRENQTVIVDTFGLEEEMQKYLTDQAIPAEEIRGRIAQSLGTIAEKIAEKDLDLTIFMTGGDTFMGFMKKMGCTSVTPVCEIEQGTVLSVIEVSGKVQQIISKSGGYGSEDVLIRIAGKLIRL